MLSQRLLGLLNQAAKNPSVSPVIIYNFQTQEGVKFDRKHGTLVCICPFCTGENLVMMDNHINIIPNGLRQFVPPIGEEK